MNKPTELPHFYHAIIEQIDNDISNLEFNSGTLNELHKERLLKLSGDNPDDSKRMTVSDIDKQFELVNHLRDMVLNDKGGLRSETGVKELASLISSINSLITLFLKAKKEIDTAKEMSLLKEAVLSAIGTLEQEQQLKFFEILDNG